MLENIGVHVDVFNDGEEAVEYFQQYPSHPYHLIFMDCQMPKMDGHQATKTLLDLWEQNRTPKIPIVALTAHVMGNKKQHCFAAGMSDHLGKPVQQKQLQSCLQKWLVEKTSK